MGDENDNNKKSSDDMQMSPMNDSKPNGDGPKHADPESHDEKLPYPKSVFFIVSNEFCERFSYYGMKAILTLYFTNSFGWDDDTATVVYHVFSSLCYFTPLLGAMLADSLLGKFRTIFYLSIIYCLGNIVLSLAATPPLNIPQIPFSLLGLGLIALGTGGIKPCVAAFGGDQFVLPKQTAQLASFFFIFYFSINSGSLISTIVTPIMRDDVKCFDGDCFTLAFSVPAGLMITALVIFLLGKPLYRVSKPTGNVVLKLVKCVWCAIGEKRKSKKEREHWLDHADSKFERRFVEDVKIVLRVLLLYIPLPVFWALFDQQGSRWTLQATRMDGKVTDSWTIKPDQVQVLNPALILIFIPIFDKLLYPLLSKCRLLRSPLQRLTVGGVLAGVAFVASAVLELELEKTYPHKLTGNQASVNFVNTLNCKLDLDFQPPILANFKLNETMSQVEIIPEGNYTVGITGTGCGIYGQFPDARHPMVALEGEGITYAVVSDGAFVRFITTDRDSPDDRAKPKGGKPFFRYIAYGPMFGQYNKTGYLWEIQLAAKSGIEIREPIRFNTLTDPGEYREHGFSIKMESTDNIQPYDLKFVLRDNVTNDIEHTIHLEEVDLELGAGYVYLITQDDPTRTELDTTLTAAGINIQRTRITEPNSLHLAWLLPQYVIITMGEVMFSITGLEFSYSQSPVSMKSVMQSAWLLTVAFGNLIVVIVAEAKFFEEQWKEFFLFAGLMFVDMFIFAIMAYRYVPAKLEDPEDVRKETEKAALEKEVEALGNDNKGFENEKK